MCLIILVLSSPIFVLVSKDVKLGKIARSRIVTVAVYSSEPVYELAQDDIHVDGAVVERFATLTNTRYSIKLRVTGSIGSRISIQLPEKAAKRLGYSEFDAVQNPTHYSKASDIFMFYYYSKSSNQNLTYCL